ncbi:hypothetical protein CDAR_591161 [Caerostris darwini]|uniref:Uncharacterized protein n=1 Tax=Caerostris darwini TaxID=1538125 RepID=A0AAV4RPM5_9ARAC|nr:hypothetical protein CDAR_591161 [Caerostris darwini]
MVFERLLKDKSSAFERNVMKNNMFCFRTRRDSFKNGASSPVSNDGYDNSVVQNGCPLEWKWKINILSKGLEPHLYMSDICRLKSDKLIQIKIFFIFAAEVKDKSVGHNPSVVPEMEDAILGML